MTTQNVGRRKLASSSTSWFDVDKAGLAKLMERRGLTWVLAELLQNAWDAPGTSMVRVEMVPAGRGLTRITVDDDSPEGFVDMAHSFTLFAESIKKADPTKRGRFNLGEKLVLALAHEASIASTTGTIYFWPDGTRGRSAKKLDAGSRFTAVLKMTAAEAAEIAQEAESFIPPVGITTIINNKTLEHREPLRSFEATLPTVIANDEGVLRPTRRKTTIAVFKRQEGRGRIFEMGIPVCESADDFDIDIQQKVPLSLERDGVTPAYLRELRALVLNETSDLLKSMELQSNSWVNDALEHPECDPEAVQEVLEARFGPKTVSYDPSDREANSRAMAAGYTVIPGRTFSAPAWNNIRAAGLLSAGRVTPTPKPFTEDGKPAEHVEPTAAMKAFAEFVKRLAREVIGRDISVTYYQTFNATAAYGAREMMFNIRVLGKSWFEGKLREEQLNLVIHELGHEYASDHFSTAYNDALTKIGAKVAFLALERPTLFDL